MPGVRRNGRSRTLEHHVGEEKVASVGALQHFCELFWDLLSAWHGLTHLHGRLGKVFGQRPVAGRHEEDTKDVEHERQRVFAHKGVLDGTARD